MFGLCVRPYNSSSQGAKTRAKYIAFAQEDKKRLEVAIAGLALDIEKQEKEVERLRREHSWIVSYHI